MSSHLRRMKNTIPIQDIPADERLEYLQGLPPKMIRWVLTDVAEQASSRGSDAAFWLMHAISQAGDNAAATDLQTVKSDAQEDIRFLAPVIVELINAMQQKGGEL